MRKFIVVGPEYPWTDVILDDGSGPTYWDRDFVHVEAENKRDARAFGIMLLRKLPGFHKYDDNPFSGLTVREIPLEEPYV